MPYLYYLCKFIFLKEYNSAYMKEAKKLRRNGVTGTMTGCFGIALILAGIGF